jgi:hypothetical protein
MYTAVTLFAAAMAQTGLNQQQRVSTALLERFAFSELTKCDGVG